MQPIVDVQLVPSTTMVDVKISQPLNIKAEYKYVKRVIGIPLDYVKATLLMLKLN